ncbi:nucleotidyltransferase domain-containing protein [Macrococcus armenti]|uniref:Nucleotidyltransferase n=1 Tax=Macrococcus armenti TaxID=2875764 RepID=A0ABY3ZVG6_9STAP|nr:nucleotidyltransferase [Macrococcus armenti]UOB20900.1 nucleotidyltransferase [Macrococcus armenti]
MCSILYSSSDFYKEEIFNQIAQKIQLTETMKKLAEKRYETIASLIHKNISPDPEIYAQGSFKMKTTSKPYESEEYDIDFIVEIESSYFEGLTPEQALTKLHKLFDTDLYREKVEIKNRCLRIKYANEFHMDFTPVFKKKDIIMVPDKKYNKYTESNPKEYMDWFETIASNYNKDFYNQYTEKLETIRSEIEELEDDIFVMKPPLKRAIQLIKRARDVYFHDKDYSPSSILLTTLYTRYTDSSYSTINEILQNVTAILLNMGKEIDATNPTLKEEDFSKVWNEDENYYIYYIEFIRYLSESLSNLNNKNQVTIFQKLFGEKIVNNVFEDRVKYNEQLIERKGMFSKGDILTTSMLFIINEAVFSGIKAKANTFYAN